MNTTLVRSIVCELSYAVTLALGNDLDQARKRPNRKTYADFMLNWGVEVATDLTVSENTKINPTAEWGPKTPVSALLTLAGGVNVGSTATGEDAQNMFFAVSDLYHPELFRQGSTERPCRDPTHNKEGSPLVDIDLQLLPLLESKLHPIELHLAGPPTRNVLLADGKNVLTKTVSIKEEISGDISPSWKFTTGAVNSSGTFLSAGRERTHQIVFTFGELSETKKELSTVAEAYHQNALIRAGYRTSLATQ
ncbi:hypothetical protein [Mesorhizobium sp. B2-6-2]|uniref:hypothetical protein n=1 Tax=Mesorhizobium sp. B2-6-2 TaxID=2589915 RepID=UPI00112C9087|nr:hypothetical protein [Mesorhizobium sp. B2-6-2]TPJ72819.1 hypothetical protein FJ419_27270 [Mesorhizobium sp. B2-6-2]